MGGKRGNGFIYERTTGMYWQQLTDDELLRYADSNHDGQIEIARRVLAGTWGTREIATLQKKVERLQAVVSRVGAVLAEARV